MDETLFTAARRVLRFIDIDMNKGGIINEQTLMAVDIMRKMIDREQRIIKMREEATALAKRALAGGQL